MADALANLALRIVWLKKNFGVCLNKTASIDCQSIYCNLRDNSDFVLNSHNQRSLSVGQQSKIKMGGLLALQDILQQSSNEKISNIFKLVQTIKKEYKAFENIPFSKIMPKISKFKFRDRS